MLISCGTAESACENCAISRGINNVRKRRTAARKKSRERSAAMPGGKRLSSLLHNGLAAQASSAANPA